MELGWIARASVVLLTGAGGCHHANPDFGGQTESMTGDGSGGGTGGTVTMTGTVPTTSADDIGDAADDPPPPPPPPPTTGTTTADTDAATDGTTDSPEPIEPAVLYVNFDGVVIFGGPMDDATGDVSMVAGNFGVDELPLEGYGDGPKREAVFDLVVQHWMPFNVEVTQTRPPRGDYTMVVVTPTNFAGKGTVSLSPADCDDQVPVNVGFVFSHTTANMTVDTTAVAISRAAASSYGLERVAVGDDIMKFMEVSVGATFVDECLPPEPPFVCPTHNVHCDGMSQQNSFAELSARFPNP